MIICLPFVYIYHWKLFSSVSVFFQSRDIFPYVCSNICPTIIRGSRHRTHQNYKVSAENNAQDSMILCQDSLVPGLIITKLQNNLIFSRQHIEIFFPMESICMKCQILFSGKIYHQFVVVVWLSRVCMVGTGAYLIG